MHLHQMLVKKENLNYMKCLYENDAIIYMVD